MAITSRPGISLVNPMSSSAENESLGFGSVVDGGGDSSLPPGTRIFYPTDNCYPIQLGAAYRVLVRNSDILAVKS